jgi:hypothetical protein
VCPAVSVWWWCVFSHYYIYTSVFIYFYSCDIKYIIIYKRHTLYTLYISELFYISTSLHLYIVGYEKKKDTLCLSTQQSTKTMPGVHSKDVDLEERERSRRMLQCLYRHIALNLVVLTAPFTQRADLFLAFPEFGKFFGHFKFQTG